MLTVIASHTVDSGPQPLRTGAPHAMLREGIVSKADSVRGSNRADLDQNAHIGSRSLDDRVKW